MIKPHYRSKKTGLRNGRDASTIPTPDAFEEVEGTRRQRVGTAALPTRL